MKRLRCINYAVEEVINAPAVIISKEQLSNAAGALIKKGSVVPEPVVAPNKYLFTDGLVARVYTGKTSIDLSIYTFPDQGGGGEVGKTKHYLKRTISTKVRSFF